MGVTGDLAKRKIIPALFSLYIKGKLSKKFHLVGFSRRNWSDEEFKEYIRPIITNPKKKISKKNIDGFLEKSKFAGGTFEDPKSYRNLSKIIKKIDKETGVSSNKLFHLATPPDFYETISKNLYKSGLSKIKKESKSWVRILVEKPFGHDLESAKVLELMLSKLFREDQIFRIDHYLAKETLQNIIAFRFSNVLFEPIWNNAYVEKIEVKMFEKEGVTERGDFYDKTGALRDVGQNHILQMLSLATMEDPLILESKAIRKERAKILESLEIISHKEIKEKTIRGQYKGYKNEKEVSSSSQTETYFKISTKINNPRWKNVPIVLEAGKAMSENKAEIKFYFKEKPTCVCELGDDQDLQNILTFHIQPRAGISMQFWANKPGFGFEVEEKELAFDYPKRWIKTHSNDAYERVLYDCLKGDQTLFASTEEILSSWKFITPILENWNKTKLIYYNKNSQVKA
jgi:glucose-6-phosphate 1-dehydrogenase